MGKRSSFKRRKNDAYATPYEAVLPLLPFLAPETHYIEPCEGEGDLISHLARHGHFSVIASDITDGIDARVTEYPSPDFVTCFITNPPWTREILHPIINNLRRQKPTWLLFDADWMHTKQARPFLPFCHAIVSVGRVKWIPDSPYTGKDNCCWYLFDDLPADQTVFNGR